MRFISVSVLLIGVSAAFPVLAACPAPGQYDAVDLSGPVDQTFLDKMATLGVDTIVRYYDHVNETIRGKTLTLRERRLIAKNGFKQVVVFQHNSRSITSFTWARGVKDANRSLELAKTMNQPMRSAIYLGVDGPWSGSQDLLKVREYFRAAAPLIRDAGYKIGAYGSGRVCELLLDAGDVDYCWLANATSWPGYDRFLASNRWTMKQFTPRTCGGREVDFNVINSGMREIGQFE